MTPGVTSATGDGQVSTGPTETATAGEPAAGRQEATLVDRLRQAGLRVTRPRLAVLAEVGDRPHATADEVLAGVRRRLGSASVQGVYDVLTALTDVGLLRRIEPQRSAARYEVRTGDNHHHAVCRICGQVTDVDCVVGEAPCLEPSAMGGLLVDEAEVVFWGTCTRCRRRRRSGDRRPLS